MQARNVCTYRNVFAKALTYSLLLGVCCCRFTAALRVGSQLSAAGGAPHSGPQGSAGGAAQLNASSGLVECSSRHGQRAQRTWSPAHSSLPVPRHGVPGHAWNDSYVGGGAVAVAQRPVQGAAEERRRRLGHSLQAATIPRIIHQVCKPPFIAACYAVHACVVRAWAPAEFDLVASWDAAVLRPLPDAALGRRVCRVSPQPLPGSQSLGG